MQGAGDTLGTRAHSPASGETGRNEAISGSCCKSEWVRGGDPRVGEVSEVAASQLGTRDEMKAAGGAGDLVKAAARA